MYVMWVWTIVKHRRLKQGHTVVPRVSRVGQHTHQVPERVGGSCREHESASYDSRWLGQQSEAFMPFT